ncbi:unnamed protein product [Timema podura]|uniref:Uncharacterized protein n=1 Tax=Timema podura TaxID=61482 RepID=A0ABN7PSS4_TIMPD|nr:unnamed protein product [Timema podura]
MTTPPHSSRTIGQCFLNMYPPGRLWRYLLRTMMTAPRAMDPPSPSGWTPMLTTSYGLPSRLNMTRRGPTVTEWPWCPP